MTPRPLRRALALAALALALAAPAALAQRQSPTPAPAARPADPFVAAQAAALAPGSAGDLDRAAEWDRYTMAVALSPDERRARGTVTVQLTNRSTATYERIYFRLYPNHPDFGGRLDVTGATVNGRPVPSGTEQGDTLIWLAAPRPLAPGGTATAELSFVARTPRNASADTFGAFNQEAGLWSLANFYPILARQFADGWDRRPVTSRGDFTVTETALYEVTVDAPAGWTLVSTGARVSAGPAGQGVRRERFVSGPQREFYLGATQGLDQASATVGGTRVVSHYQPGNAAAGRRALRVAEESLRIFGERFGPYPLAELEVVQGAMTTFLGMEYPGVVLIEQNLYRSNGRGLETTVAHEVAHQWWYSLVGNDAQGEPWLDEGLASYSQVLYYEGLGAPQQARAELNSFRDMFQASRRQGRDAPLATPPSALRGMYVPVIYAKGALFFQALRDQIGEAAFDRFLRDYYAAGRYGAVAGPDLLRAAEGACACELDQLYADWVLTAAPVPVP
ncbi:MAG TPA: M1 family metallopeptidase [Chloroflexaceae bacterium]|nr:M1 family metallopeptidase [Chloroflexaceae bacterium]